MGLVVRCKRLSGRVRLISALGALTILMLFYLMANIPLDTLPTRINLVQASFKGSSPTIPKIIHQSFKGDQIPAQYWNSVSSWRKLHPDYVYFLWTDADIENFIQEEYPDFVPLFRSFTHKLQRVDAARYFILYHYGGIYADMDVDAIKPLDPLLSRFSCIISRERYEQTMFLWSKKESLMNCLMASTPRHPFIKFIMLNLQHSQTSSLFSHVLGFFGNYNFILKSTGPLAITEMFYRYKPCWGNPNSCDVYLAEPEVFLPTIKKDTLEDIIFFCKSWLLTPILHLSPWKRQACQELEKVRYRNTVAKGSYTNHKFTNLGYKEKEASSEPHKKVSDLVGQVKHFSSAKKLLPDQTRAKVS